MDQINIAWFPWDKAGKGTCGSLVKNKEFYSQSRDGNQIYFSSQDVANEIAKVENAGGKVLSPRKEITPDIGAMALFMDAEGNRISLHCNDWWKKDRLKLLISRTGIFPTREIFYRNKKEGCRLFRLFQTLGGWYWSHN